MNKQAAQAVESALIRSRSAKQVDLSRTEDNIVKYKAQLAGAEAEKQDLLQAIVNLNAGIANAREYQ